MRPAPLPPLPGRPVRISRHPGDRDSAVLEDPSWFDHAGQGHFESPERRFPVDGCGEFAFGGIFSRGDRRSPLAPRRRRSGSGARFLQVMALHRARGVVSIPFNVSSICSLAGVSFLSSLQILTRKSVLDDHLSRASSKKHTHSNLSSQQRRAKAASARKTIEGGCVERKAASQEDRSRTLLGREICRYACIP